MKIDEWGDAGPGALSIEPLEVSRWRGEQDGVWALPGVVLALLNLLVLEILRRDSGGLDSSRGAAASYALAAFSASLLAVMASLNGVSLTAILALHLPAIAIVDASAVMPPAMWIPALIGTVGVLLALFGGVV